MLETPKALGTILVKTPKDVTMDNQQETNKKRDPPRLHVKTILMWYDIVRLDRKLSMLLTLSLLPSTGRNIFVINSLLFSRCYSNSTNNYNNLENPVYNSSFTAQQLQVKLNPFWITGFTDGEGSFITSIQRSTKLRIGWEVKISFSITLHKKDRAILELFQSVWGVGTITDSKTSNSVLYRVSDLSNLNNIIIPHHFLVLFFLKQNIKKKKNKNFP